MFILYQVCNGTGCHKRWTNSWLFHIYIFVLRASISQWSFSLCVHVRARLCISLTQNHIGFFQ